MAAACVVRRMISATACNTMTSNALMTDGTSKALASSSRTSAIESSLPLEARSFYREVLLALNDHGLQYAVAGAFALQKYTGISRQTKDLDVFMKGEDVPAALHHLERMGFRCEVADAVWLAKAHRGEYYVDLISGMSNAVILVDDSWMRRTQPATIAGVSSQIISVEDLLSSKLFVIRRERFDGADIAHIIYRTCGELDWERILHLAGEHWEILLWNLMLFRYVYPAHTHFVPTPLWQDLLSRFQHAIRNPNGSAPFRGSIVDENMFRIDVDDWGLEDIQEDYRMRALHRRAKRTAAMQANSEPKTGTEE
jgi:putative nucleotidyltransferase-like protein